MIPFAKAMRDQQGDLVKNAHLLGLFRRLGKVPTTALARTTDTRLLLPRQIIFYRSEAALVFAMVADGV